MSTEKLRQGLLALLFPILCWDIYTHNADSAKVELIDHYLLADVPDKAGQLAMKAFARNPTNGKLASQLLSLYSRKGQTQDSARLADIAGSLWPVHTDVHSHLADYWAQQQRIDKLLPEWNILLTRSPSLRNRIFPSLEQIAQQPEYSRFFQPYIVAPPLWWNDFFQYIATNAELSFVRNLYLKRAESKTALSKTEQDAFINRLLKDKQWREAYTTWKQALPVDRQKLLGPPFDGGFENELSGSGFDWQIQAAPGLQIQAETSNDVNGGKALHILLSKDRHINFQHVSQKLVLDPVNYRFKIRYRADRLKTSKGLRWRIRCLDDMNHLLAESQVIAAKTPWSILSSPPFTVPSAGCTAQLLRLEADSKYAHHQVFDGSIWFDDAYIEKLDKDDI